MKEKRQKIVEGSFIKIDILENRCVFARQFSSDLGVYNFIAKQDENIPSLQEIAQKNTMFYCAIYDAIITKGVFEIIGIIPLTNEEIIKVPPKFIQGKVNYNCTI